MRLRVAQTSKNPKKIIEVVINFVFGNPMHNKSFGLEGEEQFGYCTRKIDTLEDSHHSDKVKISLP
jgi:hypothetical protein